MLQMVVVIFGEDRSTISNKAVSGPCLQDHAGSLSMGHFAITFNMAHMKPSRVQKKLKDIDIYVFHQDIINCTTLLNTVGTADNFLDASEA